MQYKYRIPTWGEYQHYKDRNPPWIKLHYETLSSATWVTLDDASRVLAIACMLIASRHDGKIPADDSYIRRVAYLNKKPNYSPLITAGFLEPLADASTMLADARPETEAYSKETETEYMSDFESLWKIYPRKDGSKKKALTIYKQSLKEGVHHDTIERGVNAYAKNVRGTEKRYIAHFATWLNQARWESDYSGPTSGDGSFTSEGKRLAEKYRLEAERQGAASPDGQPALRSPEAIREEQGRIGKLS